MGKLEKRKGKMKKEIPFKKRPKSPEVAHCETVGGTDL